MTDQTRIKHTPGPWRTDGITIKAIDHGQWFTVARAYGPRLTAEGNQANARLIAAAPDLLEELKQIERWMSGYGTASQSEMREKVRAAIAKAEGSA